MPSFTQNHPSLPAHNQSSLLDITFPNKKNYTEDFSNTHKFDDLLPLLRRIDSPDKPVFIPQDVKYIWIDETLTKQMADNLKKQIRHFLEMSLCEQKKYMDQISTVRRITEHDCHNDACDSELLGQNGCFATADIPAYTLLGHYSGLFLTSVQDYDKLCHKYSISGMHAYMFGTMTSHSWPKISAFQNGNRISIVNSASNYRHGPEKTQNLLDTRQNVIILYAKSNNNPISHIANDDNQPDMVFYLVHRHTKSGQQLMVDYGPSYWLP